MQSRCAAITVPAVRGVALLLVGLLGPPQGRAAPLSPANATITVANTVVGQTTTYIGATEAGVFFIADLTDLGINSYRMWTKFEELEWWDDDDYVGGANCTEIGTPTIAEIKADQASGFSNTIPWSFWDTVFQNQTWWSGHSREEVIAQCVNSGITPVLVLRNRDENNNPSQCGGDWAPEAPITAADLNEWWAHAFAVAYWLNVKHSYGVTHFEGLNEPDLSSQGWNGSQSEYVQLVEQAYDAVKFANDIAGIDTVVHAPVVSNSGSGYIANALDNADQEIQVVDYHNYDADPTSSITTVKGLIASHNPDAVVEPIWLSEWGTYTSSYNTLSRALLTALQLMIFSEQEVEGVTVFGMYDWGSYSGLLDTSRNKSETYYAYRLMIRGLKGGKDRLQFSASGVGGQVMVTRGSGKLYLIVRNGGATIDADVSALGVSGGTVQVYEYSSSNKDVVVATPTMSAGRFTFTAPGTGLALAEVSSPELAVELETFSAEERMGRVVVTWTTLSEVGTAGFNIWRGSSRDGPYVRRNAALIAGRGDALTGARYSFADAAVVAGRTYYYRLEEVDTRGRLTTYGPVSVTVHGGPERPPAGSRLYLPRLSLKSAAALPIDLE